MLQILDSGWQISGLLNPKPVSLNFPEFVRELRPQVCDSLHGSLRPLSRERLECRLYLTAQGSFLSYSALHCESLEKKVAPNITVVWPGRILMIKSGLTFGCEDITCSIHCAKWLKLVVQQTTSLPATSTSRLKYREMKYFATNYTDFKPKVGWP